MKNTMMHGEVVFLILLACIAGLSIHNPFKKIIFRHDVLATVNDCPYTYINQLRCEPDTKERIIEYTTLRNDLISLIEEEKRKGTVSSISVYFRDLQNGPTISINAQENFIPA